MSRHVGSHHHHIQCGQDLLSDWLAGGVDGGAGEVHLPRTDPPSMRAVLHLHAYTRGSGQVHAHRGLPL